MSEIHIGGIHKLNVAEDAQDNPILWINQRSKKFFSTLRELDGKKVLVRTRTRAIADQYIVSLVDMPQDTFYISKKYLVTDSGPEPIPCECELNILVNRGCQCGAFQKEKT